MKYRSHLPQLDGGPFLSHAGIETVLIFNEGLELPEFAAFLLLEDEDGTAALRAYYEPYLALARERGLGFVLESPTWRAGSRWAAALGQSEADLDRLNRRAIALMEEVREEHADHGAPLVIAACVGPGDDGYRPAARVSAAEARDHHVAQLTSFADTGADMVDALTLTYAEEAIGIASAAAEVGLPVAISFTLETDGRLPSGQTLGEAIAQVEDETDAGPAYYMLNCAHPMHFADGLPAGEPWLERVRGLHANASTKSHAELDEATDLDSGDPTDLAARYVALAPALPRLSVLGGCCGTDHRHVEAIRDAWLAR
jgi:homocysteine S-methyltransferase